MGSKNKKKKQKKNAQAKVQQHLIDKKKTKVNPFDFKYNHQKHYIVGRDHSKPLRDNLTSQSIAGNPSKSHQRAQEERLSKIKAEISKSGKVGKVIDKRKNQNGDQANLVRFGEIRAQQYQKQQIAVNPDEDVEILTHYGQSIASYDHLNDRPTAGYNSDSDDGDALNAQFVGQANFGGFDDDYDKKSIKNPNLIAIGGNTESGLSKRKQMIKTMISTSREAKLDRRLMREANMELTERLDEKWKQTVTTTDAFRNLIATKEQREDSNVAVATAEREEENDYDMLFCQLQATPSRRAAASDRVKSELELAQEKAEKLTKLEKERLDRMLPKHDRQRRQEDDQHPDALSLPKKVKDDDGAFVVQYRNGRLVNAHRLEKPIGFKKSTDYDETSEEDESDNVEENEDTTDDDSEYEIEVDDEEEKEDHRNDEDNQNIDKQKKALKDDNIEKRKEDTGNNVIEKQKEDTRNNSNTLPYLIPMPNNYSSLQVLLDSQQPVHWLTIIDRLITLNHVCLKEENKYKIDKLMVLTLRHFDATASKLPLMTTQQDRQTLLEKLSILSTAIFRLMKSHRQLPNRLADNFINILETYYNKYEENENSWPQFNVLAIVQLVSKLYPTSDAEHPICTPAAIYSTHVISTSRVTSVMSIRRGLLWCKILLKFVEKSRRYISEVNAFLHGVLRSVLGSKQPFELFVTSTPTCTFANLSLLHVDEIEKESAQLIEPLECNETFDFLLRSFQKQKNDDKLNDKVQTFSITLDIIRLAANIWKDIEGIGYANQILLRFLRLINLDIYHKRIQTKINDLIDLLSNQLTAPICIESSVMTKIPMIEFLEPDVKRGSYKSDDRKNQNAVKMRQSLKQTYNREMRGAIRDLRRDASARVAIERTQRHALDRKREEKTKMIIKSLRNQESAINSKKGKKK